MTAAADRAPLLVAIATVGVTLSVLLMGYEPIGGDPDRLYRPIKSELARSLAQGELPFWSDRFGLGVPLVAESHVAAFYPPNWLLYRVLDVSTAYRVSMWLHYVLLVGATYLYARRLGLIPWGAALAAVAFTLCGFQAIHSNHEPLYSALPLLMLALYFTEKYVANGARTALMLLALTWGVQLTLGHFQIQLWTAVLVLVTGLWRVLESGSYARALGLLAGLTLGGAMAAVQLVLSWDLARVVGTTHRPVEDLMYFAYPPAHWSELAIPRLFQGLEGGPNNLYWQMQGTSGNEASLYVGTMALILAFVGVLARRDRALAPWRVIVPLSFALATMPQWWPAGYQLIVQVPGFSFFRAPGRYTLITSLGLALLAGRGFDRSTSTPRFATGLILAVAFAGTAAAWALHWGRRPEYHVVAGDADLRRFIAVAVLVWLVSLAMLLAWRARKLPHLAPFAVAGMELGVLYYHGPTIWGASIDVASASPVLRRLAQEPDAGTVAGHLDGLAVHAGRSSAYAHLGMKLPPPTSELEFARYSLAVTDPLATRMLRRLGATHGAWKGPVPETGAEILFQGEDDTLDNRAFRAPGVRNSEPWSLVRHPETSPPAYVARHAADATDLRTLLLQLAQAEDADTALFLPGDRPADSPEPRAQTARVIHWNGLSGDVDHDGTCDLVIRRSYTRGWTARLNGGAEIPLVPVNGGLQSVRLVGSGRTHVALHYRPPRLVPALVVSVTSVGLVLVMLVIDGLARRRQSLDSNR